MPTLKIEYWRSETNEEFEGLDDFASDVSKDFKFELLSRECGACGGGTYEFLMEVIDKLSLAEFVADYAKEGAKGALTFALGAAFHQITKLFSRNKKLYPDVAAFTMSLKGTKIFLYSLYDNSVSEVIPRVFVALSEHHDDLLRLVGAPITEIHIPIFDQVDTYELCTFRVRLNVDENISRFSAQDFLKLWGIRCASSRQFVYSLSERTAVEAQFYTQQEYDKLFEKSSRGVGNERL